MIGHESDQAVRDALDAIADQVHVSPGAYHTVRAEWLRRQRRRKRLGVLVAILLVVIADVIGVWALNRTDTSAPVIFEQQAPVSPGPSPPPGLSQP